MQPDFEPITPAVVEWQGDTPYATRFGDGYFSRDDGVGESLAVFIEGNHLQRRFAELSPGEVFAIGETGFGTGLNMLQAANLFARTAPAGARLSLISAERHPLAAEDLARAVRAWPRLSLLAERLHARYPPLTPGFHRLRLADDIDLTLMYGDAAQMWRNQAAAVDAWFLDGFAPDRNGELWHPELLSLLARRSRPGATLATFTVAGPVRRGLTAAGFRIQRLPGFGGKRHRLEGCLPGRWRARRFSTGSVIVAGAGLAGATTARALAERGWNVRVLDPAGIATGASGNRAGVVYTTPSGAATPQNRFYQASYLHATDWLKRFDAAGIGTFNGVIQHITNATQQRKLQQATSSGHWPAAQMQWLDDDTVMLADGGYLQPAGWCAVLLDHPAISFDKARVESIDASGRAALSSGDCDHADAVVLCIAGAASALPGLPGFPLRRIRGQVTECRATRASRRWERAQCHDGYLTPAVDGLHCLGATFDPRDPDPAPRDSDDRANLEQLRDRLPECWQQLGGGDIEVVSRRVAFRCQANDYLPVVGHVPGSRNQASAPLMLNLGHGSRGISGTPLVADLLADTLSKMPTAVDKAMQDALDPARFELRAHARRPDKR